MDGDAINRLRLLFSKVCVDFQSELVQMDGEDHHVHLLVKYPPKVAISNGELAEGCFQSYASTRTTRLGCSLLERRAPVAIVLRRQLWRGTCQHPSRIHRASKDTALTRLISPP